MNKNLTMLMILDGFGKNPNKEGNAVEIANTPNIDKLMKENPTTTIYTSGLHVGLPEGQMGNSEVGHTNIGAGRIVYQELTRITKSIEDGDFFEIPELKDAMESAKVNGKKLHIMGLVSDGGVHSHQKHLYGLLEMAKREGLDQVYVHCFMDGRDTLPTSGKGYIEELEKVMQEKGIGKIATISGRFYAMDRDKRWNRIEKAYDAMVRGEGEKFESATSLMDASYANDITDEFVIPAVIEENGKPVAKIEEGDSVIFFNFRPDRARQITRTLVDPDFTDFNTEKLDLNFVCMTPYDETMPNVKIAFKKETLKNTVVSNHGLTQLRTAETEKYAHVTFFFNGGEEKQFKGEDRILVASPKVETYDLKPEMSAYEVTENVVKAINDDKYDAIILNFANPDMVGHTGVIPAAVKAVETVDECIGKIVEALSNHEGRLLITADHGNCEQEIDYETGEPLTSHTTNPVPIVMYGVENATIENGRLCDIAPTMLDIMGIEKPEEMTGVSLLKRQ